jgi:hypothetical protein
METLLQNGQLGTGPHFYKNPDYPHGCVHMTFSHACGLASGLIHQRLLTQPAEKTDSLPCDVFPWSKKYQTVNVITHRSKFMMATLAGPAYSVSKDTFIPRMPTGGCLSYLWGKGYGPVQVGSQYQYQRIEPGNMPESFDRPGNLTPRIEHFALKGEMFSSIFERTPTLNLISETVSKCRGQLKNLKGATCGVGYEITYEFRESGIRKNYQVGESPKGLIFMREPIVFDPDLCTFERAKHSIRILGPNGGVHITSSCPLVCQNPTRDTLLWCPFPSVYCVDLKFEFAGDSTYMDFEVIS